MNKKGFSLLPILLTLILSVGFASTRVDTLKVLKPQPKHQLELNYVKQILANIHFRKVPLSDSLSRVIYDNYLESLDFNKSYFLQSDVDYFSKYRDTMDDNLEDGNLDVAFQMFRIFRERSNTRLNHVMELLDQGFDFDKDESVELDDEDISWAKNSEELNERWRKIIKSQALNLKLKGKTDSAIQKLLVKRYKRYRKNINQNNNDDVFQTFMNSYTETLDPHTNYFSPVSSDNFNINMSNSLEGIGARLTQDSDYTVIDEKIPGGPAYKSKEIFKDDKIIGVGQGEEGDFVDVIGWRLRDVVQLIRGPKGSVVRLQVIRGEMTPADPAIVRLERDKINLKDQLAKSEIIPITEGGETFNMGLITIPSFYLDFKNVKKGGDYNSVANDVRDLITDLKTKNIDGLLIDLRYNGGGSLEEAIKMTGLFIDQGPVVQVKNYNGKIKVHSDNNSNVLYTGPLAVLTNRFSASASEIFSGAIQDYGRGIILGETTFGKGTVQRMISLNQQLPNYPEKLGNIKLTLQMFYRINGSSTQNIGVAPDIMFPTPFDSSEFGESSKPSALPWDKIPSSDYEQVNYISDDLRSNLLQLYKHHLETDRDLKKLNEDVEKAKNEDEKNTLSLNYETRKTAREKEKERAKVNDELEGTEIVLDNEFVVTEEDNKKLKKDPYLKEGLRLLAEIVRFKVG